MSDPRWDAHKPLEIANHEGSRLTALPDFRPSERGWYKDGLIIDEGEIAPTCVTGHHDTFDCRCYPSTERSMGAHKEAAAALREVDFTAPRLAYLAERDRAEAYRRTLRFRFGWAIVVLGCKIVKRAWWMRWLGFTICRVGYRIAG